MRQPADRAEEQTETAAEIKVSLPFQIIIPGNIRNLLCRRRRRLLLMRLQVKLPVALLFTADRQAQQGKAGHRPVLKVLSLQYNLQGGDARGAPQTAAAMVLIIVLINDILAHPRFRNITCVSP